MDENETQQPKKCGEIADLAGTDEEREAFLALLVNGLHDTDDPARVIIEALATRPKDEARLLGEILSHGLHAEVVRHLQRRAAEAVKGIAQAIEAETGIKVHLLGGGALILGKPEPEAGVKPMKPEDMAPGVRTHYGPGGPGLN